MPELAGQAKNWRREGVTRPVKAVNCTWSYCLQVQEVSIKNTNAFESRVLALGRLNSNLSTAKKKLNEVEDIALERL